MLYPRVHNRLASSKSRVTNERNSSATPIRSALSFSVSPPTPSLSFCGCGYSAPRMPRRQKRNRKARVRAGPYLRRVYPHLRGVPRRPAAGTCIRRPHACTYSLVRQRGWKLLFPVSPVFSLRFCLLVVLRSVFSNDKLKCDLRLVFIL